MTLLPAPFSTDCFEYSINANDEKSPSTQQMCMFEYMQEKERNVCGQNYFWNQFSINESETKDE